MKTRFPVLCLALGATFLLTACHGVARKTYSSYGQPPMRTVGVISVEKPDDFALVQLGFQPTMMFGAIGGIVAAVGDTYKAGVVDDALKLRGFDPASELEKELTRTVRAAGYEVVSVGPRARGRDGFAESYSGLSPKTDLVLDASISSIGFQSVSVSAPWRPAMSVPVRLVSGSTGEVLYSDLLIIGEGNIHTDAKHVAADPGYHYGSYTDIRDQAHTAVEGLRKGLVAIADEVGGSIGRGTATPAAPALAGSAPAPANDPVMATVAAPVTARAPVAPVQVQVAASTPEASPLGRCQPATVHAMKRDGASEIEISGACRADLEAVRTLLR